jgi:signal transduction histidine kinase
MDRFSFLADVSRSLSASLDYETTLATVARIALPDRESWSVVDLLDDDGSIRRLSTQHPLAPDAMIGAASALRSGTTSVAHGADASAHVSVPLIARGAVLGAITFVFARADQHPSDVDVALAEDLAGRAAMAIDNARLLRDARTARHVTETAMDAAQEAGRRKSEFLATMGHEFRTPLNAILGYSQILDMGVLGPNTPAQHAHLERLQASARHLLQLVDDVLDVAKADADRLEVRQESLVTGSTVASAVSLVHPQATAKGIRLIDLGSAAPGVPYMGDERRVRQILVNLLSNAVKFTPSGGEVTVNCGSTQEPDPGAQLPGGSLEPASEESPDETRNWAFIRITDTGPGIQPAFMSRLFEPFVQADSALTREKGGTGLGLAISRRLARRMGGDLTVRSREGAGATFTLWMPTREPGATAPATTGSFVSPTARRTPAGTLSSVAASEYGLDDAAYAVLYAIGTKLSTDAEVIAERYVAAMREDGRFPGAHDLHNAQLRDHATPFIGLLASQLTVLGETCGKDPELLADGGHLQRLVAELHGAQRHRLGWNESDIERETKILVLEVERSINASVNTVATQEATRGGPSDAVRESVSPDAVSAARQYALDVASRVLELGARTTIRTFRFAKNADAP